MTIKSALIVDDSKSARIMLQRLLEKMNVITLGVESAEEALTYLENQHPDIIFMDHMMPGMDGLALQQKLRKLLSQLPIIFISGHGDIPMAVEAMRHGALDFIRKPIDQALLLKRINEAYQQVIAQQQNKDGLSQLVKQFQSLTKRESEIFELVCDGTSNKAIAADLSISERTVEVHRANVMQKFAVSNLAELVKIKISLG